jgi:hypothetical protein
VRRGEAGKLLKQLKGIRSVTPPRFRGCVKILEQGFGCKRP